MLGLEAFLSVADAASGCGVEKIELKVGLALSLLVIGLQMHAKPACISGLLVFEPSSTVQLRAASNDPSIAAVQARTGCSK